MAENIRIEAIDAHRAAIETAQSRGALAVALFQLDADQAVDDSNWQLLNEAGRSRFVEVKAAEGEA